MALMYFMLPAYFANMAASLSKKLKFLKPLEAPIDFGETLEGKPIFGSHKTWRGAIFGLVVGMLIAWFQLYLYQFDFFKEISFFDYRGINIFIFGFLFSFGDIAGDLFFAFLKRRKGIAPGKTWIPFDQINYVIGSFLFLTPYLKLEFKIWISALVLTFFLHILTNLIAYFAGWQKNKW